MLKTKLYDTLTDQDLMTRIKQYKADAEAITKEMGTLLSIISRDLKDLGINISILNDLVSEKEKRNNKKIN
ncbi:hypothetical protein ACSSWA_01455 [Melioribacter sp. Ez-97]|uniref:hypothetical protein n=1 Tax=Melioribacter sp. Ez-97 TaxID=3423434 RepID=UPI003ED9F093